MMRTREQIEGSAPPIHPDDYELRMSQLWLEVLLDIRNLVAQRLPEPQCAEMLPTEYGLYGWAARTPAVDETCTFEHRGVVNE